MSPTVKAKCQLQLLTLWETILKTLVFKSPLVNQWNEFPLKDTVINNILNPHSTIPDWHHWKDLLYQPIESYLLGQIPILSAVVALLKGSNVRRGAKTCFSLPDIFSLFCIFHNCVLQKHPHNQSRRCSLIKYESCAQWSKKARTATAFFKTAFL